MNLLPSTKESVFEDENFLTGNSPLQSLSRLLYDEFIKSILKIIEKLDLTVQKLNVHEQVRSDDLSINCCYYWGTKIPFLIFSSSQLYKLLIESLR